MLASVKRRWLVLLAVALAPSSAASGAIARSTADQPDDSGLPQIHLMYVVPSDGVDRGFDVNGTIVDSTASWEGWLAGQTGGRSVRLDTYLGQPDVTFARLPQNDSQIASNGPRMRASTRSAGPSSNFGGGARGGARSVGVTSQPSAENPRVKFPAPA